MSKERLEHLKTCWNCSVSARCSLFIRTVGDLYRDLALQTQKATIEVYKTTLRIQEMREGQPDLDAMKNSMESSDDVASKDTISSSLIWAKEVLQYANEMTRWSKNFRRQNHSDDLETLKTQSEVACCGMELPDSTTRLDRLERCTAQHGKVQQQIEAGREKAAILTRLFNEERNSALIQTDIVSAPLKRQQSLQGIGIRFAEQCNIWFHCPDRLEIAPEYLTLFIAIVNDLIYIVECRKPAEVPVSLLDGNRLRRLVRASVPLLCPTFSMEDGIEWGHLVGEFLTDFERFRIHLDEHKNSTPDLAKEFGISLDMTNQLISRSGSKYEHIEPIHLSAAIWDLLRELLSAGKNGTTRKQLAEKLKTSERAISTRKTALKNSLFVLDLTIPGDEFRLAAIC